MEQSYSSFLAGLGLISIITGIVMLIFIAWSVI
ncbi:hypothetical protein L1278_002295 [Pontibacter sp. HSC-36F09]|nr:hypothetical protein [Pontibacter sp. HSC-36F09]